VVRTIFCADFFGFSQFLTAISKKKTVAPSSDGNEKNCVAHLKEQSLLKKTLKTASKSGNKRQRNAWSNYAPLERTVLLTRSVTKNTTFSHLHLARIVRSSPNFAR